MVNFFPLFIFFNLPLISLAWFFSLFGGCPMNCPPPAPPPPPPHVFRNAYPVAPQPQYPIAQYPVAPPMSIPPNAYALPPAYPLPPRGGYAVPPPVYVTPPTYPTPPPTYPTPPPTYPTPPPPRCFQNGHGYKCCNKELNMFLDEMVVQMQHPKWHGCNLQRFATQIQHQAQSHMENLSHYRGDLYCKKKAMDGKIVLLYGTVVPYALEDGETRPMTPEEITRRMYPSIYNDVGMHNGHENNIQF
ncbi:unnamed protein product [Caenorhabditis angaria]|uniref:Ground-like domain-containing protein n=1 Tax=Caenorhabditis angaria TaxID=860376 RepID=A0A9P1IV93_9PELO|nr:unnamed protein product [Caenorhabditis angaria]